MLRLAADWQTSKEKLNFFIFWALKGTRFTLVFFYLFQDSHPGCITRKDYILVLRDVSTPPRAIANAFTESGRLSLPLEFELHRRDRGLEGLRRREGEVNRKYIRLGVRNKKGYQRSHSGWGG